MDLSPFTDLPNPIRDIIIGGAGNYVGSLAWQISTSIVNAASVPIRKKFRPEPQQLALNQSIAEALAHTLRVASEDVVHMEHLLNLFGEWTEQEDVQYELSKIITLESNEAIDLPLLRQEFEKLYDPDQLGIDIEFDQLISEFATALADAVVSKPTLQGQIQINLLRNIDRELRGIRSGTPPAADIEDAQTEYLRYIVNHLERVSLRGMDVRSSDVAQQKKQPRLADIYIQLNVTQRSLHGRRGEEFIIEREGGRGHKLVGDSDEEIEPTAINALIHQPQLILLGGPGSGKSTFVQYLTFCVANHHLEPEAGWLSQLGDWPTQWRDLIPIPIILRELAAWMAKENAQPRQLALLHGYLEHLLESRDQKMLASHLRQSLKDGKAILFLDGLDEVPAESGLLQPIKEMIATLTATHTDTPIVVTCRVRSFDDSRWRLEELDWPVFALDLLNTEQIQTFVEAWYAQLAANGLIHNPTSWSDSLNQAIQKQADLLRLAQTPLLLTMMAMVHHSNEGGLPDERARLYEQVVKLLLTEWDAAKIDNPDGEEISWRQLLKSANVNDMNLTKALWKLAYVAHGQMPTDASSEATADIPRDQLRTALCELNHQAATFEWAEQVMEGMKLRAGLLVEDDDQIYRFPHRTFQEYLAGCHLTNSEEVYFVEEAEKLARQGAFWREVLLLSIGRFVHVESNLTNPLGLIGELCRKKRPQDTDTESWQAIILAGECILEMSKGQAEKRENGRELVERTRKHLTHLITHNLLTPKERARAGSIVSALGDDLRDLDEMCHVPAGKFLMGSTEGDEHAYDDEKPQHTVRLDEFWISKYPVTNGQYAKFIDANPEQRPPNHWIERTPPPELLNHPVVYVSWHDAQAYCKWLSQVREGDREFRLPTEAEWEKAARGTDGRIFSWGHQWDDAYCNNREAGISDTSSVGIFTHKENPHGCEDMLGNVWEWTISLWGKDTQNPEYKYPYDEAIGERENLDAPDEVYRVLRGGSWDLNISYARCAARNGLDPYYRFSDIGFRLMSPSL